MLTRTTTEPAATSPRMISWWPIERSRRIDVLADVGAHRHHTPVQRQPPRHIVAIGRGEDWRKRTQRRQPPRRAAAAGDGHDGLRIAAIGEHHRRLTERLRVVVRAGRVHGRGTADRRGAFGFANDGVERLHRARGEGADRRFGRQHDRVHPIVDRAGGVVHLGARRARLHRHRFQHLRGQNDGNAMVACAPRDVLLRARHPFERHLEAQVASRDHDGVGRGENLLEVIERRGPLQLRDKRDIRRAGVSHQLTRLSDVCRGLHEAERHHVHAERQPERQVVDVLRCDRRCRQADAGSVDPLVLADLAAFDHGRLDLLPIRLIDPQLDEPVGQQHPIAGPDARREARECGRNAARPADETVVAGRDRQAIAGPQAQRPSPSSFPVRIFGPPRS